MATIDVSVTSTLPPEEALRVLTDFGPGRVEAWPGVDAEHLTVHARGEDFADVTEGNSVGWERERYTWDAAAGTVSAVTVESNLWAPGSRWDYTLTPAAEGTTVQVRLVRHGRGVKGRLIEALLPLIGPRTVRQGLAQALKVTDG